MLQDKKYEIIREYGNLYGLEELVRRIIRRHIRDNSPRKAMPECPRQGVNDYAEQFGG